MILSTVFVWITVYQMTIVSSRSLKEEKVFIDGYPMDELTEVNTVNDHEATSDETPRSAPTKGPCTSASAYAPTGLVKTCDDIEIPTTTLTGPIPLTYCGWECGNVFKWIFDISNRGISSFFS